MGFWDWITGGPRKRRIAEAKRLNRLDRLKKDGNQLQEVRHRQTRASRGGSIQRDDGGPPFIPVYGFGDPPTRVHDPRDDRDSLDDERHGVMGTRSHEGFKTGGGFGADDGGFKTGGYDSSPSPSSDSYSSDSGSSGGDSGGSDGGGGGGD